MMKKICFLVFCLWVTNLAMAGEEVFFKPVGPWVPVSVDHTNHSVSISGRDYIFSPNSLMPAQITSLNQELFQSGCELNIIANGIQFKPAGIKIQYGDVSKISAKMHVSGMYIGNEISLAVSADYLFEFDGFVWIDLKISQPDSSKVILEKVEFVAPFRSTVARNLSYARSRYYRSEPEDIAGIVNLVEQAEWTADQFRPFVTIANETIGLNWFAENRKNWQGEENQYLATGKNDRVFGVRFINQPVELIKDLELGFGFMALPIRELKPEQACTFDYLGEAVGNTYCEPKDYALIDLDEMRKEGVRDLLHFYWGPFSHPFPHDPDDFRRLVREANEKGIRYYPYYSYSAVDLNVGVVKENREKFLMRPFRGEGKRTAWSYGYICSNSKEYQEYVISSIQKLVDEYGIRGLYTDCCKIYECNSVFHGCGDGGDLFNYPIRAVRRISKAIFRVMKTADPTNRIIYHRSGFTIHGPYDCFSDMRATGERLLIQYRDQEFKLDETLLAALRVSHTPSMEGIPFAWIDKGNRNSHMSLVQGLALKSLHQLSSFGVLFYLDKKADFKLQNLTTEYREAYEAYRKVRTVYDQFGMESAEWHPYHLSHSAIKVEPENPKTLIKCSYYSKKGERALLILANLSSDSGRARINIDLDELGLPSKGLHCVDHLTNQPLSLNGDFLDLHFNDTKKQGSFYLVELSTTAIKPTGKSLAEIEKSTWPWKAKNIQKTTLRERVLIKQKGAGFDFTKASGRDVLSGQFGVRGELNGYTTNPWETEDGEQALCFDGETNYLSIEKGINAKLDIKTELSIEIEFKARKVEGDKDQVLLYKGGAYQVFLDSQMRLHFGIKMDGEKWVVASSKVKLEPDVWHRCSFTFDRNSLTIYKQGFKIGSKPAQGDVPNNSYPLIVGASYNVTKSFFNGLMRNMTIFNKALNYESD